MRGGQFSNQEETQAEYCWPRWGWAKPCSCTFHLYLFIGSWKLEGRLKTQWGRSWGWSKIVRNTSFMSQGAKQKAQQGRRETRLQSPHRLHHITTASNNLHFPDLSLLTKIGVFQGTRAGLTMSSESCSSAKHEAAGSSSCVSSHWSTSLAV